jgi:predicted RNA polymerase sigma factor
VGSALVRALITSAQARGVTSVAMDALPGNHQVLALIAGHWAAARTGHSRDYDTICVQLPHARRRYAGVSCSRRAWTRPGSGRLAG